MTNQNESFSIQSLELGPMENFIYLIHDTDSKRVAVVDPAWDANEIINQVKINDLQITDILLTHSHFDHINAIEGLLKKYDAQVHLLKAEANFWGRHPDNPILHSGGDTIQLGNTNINVLHTPGHTPGSACYHVGNHLIAGDTLFVYGCGRCDLDGGDPNQMHQTLNDLKTNLPKETILHPGHNYAEKEISTMEEQIEGNPFMHFEDPVAFVQYRM
ncbi:MAG: MBL fold metallo-hydrolase, partial [Gammaproteobacteria bacterium]|nr:MBL fold metallo-hydrolase [Gammaproteobacteria bacterium]